MPFTQFWDWSTSSSPLFAFSHWHTISSKQPPLSTCTFGGPPPTAEVICGWSPGQSVCWFVHVGVINSAISNTAADGDNDIGELEIGSSCGGLLIHLEDLVLLWTVAKFMLVIAFTKVMQHAMLGSVLRTSWKPGALIATVHETCTKRQKWKFFYYNILFPPSISKPRWY